MCGGLPACVHRKILGVVSVFLIFLKVQLCQELAGLHYRVVSVLQQTVRAIYLRWGQSRENRITKRPQNTFNRHATFKRLPCLTTQLRWMHGEVSSSWGTVRTSGWLLSPNGHLGIFFSTAPDVLGLNIEGAKNPALTCQLCRHVSRLTGDAARSRKLRAVT